MFEIGCKVKDKSTGKIYEIIDSFFENISFVVLRNTKTNKTCAVEKVLLYQDYYTTV